MVPHGLREVGRRFVVVALLALVLLIGHKAPSLSEAIVLLYGLLRQGCLRFAMLLPAMTFATGRPRENMPLVLGGGSCYMSTIGTFKLAACHCS